MPCALCLPAGLRALQGRKQLEELVKSVKITRDKMEWGPQVGASCRFTAQSYEIKYEITRNKMEWGPQVSVL